MGRRPRTESVRLIREIVTLEKIRDITVIGSRLGLSPLTVKHYAAEEDIELVTRDDFLAPLHRQIALDPDNPALRHALEYYGSLRRLGNALPIDQVTRFYSYYGQIDPETNNLYTLRELAELSLMSPSSASKVLKGSKLKAPVQPRSQEKRSLRDPVYARIYTGYFLPLSVPDISHFCDVPNSLVLRHFRRLADAIGSPRNFSIDPFDSLDYLKSPRRSRGLQYREASMSYQLLDRERSPEEVVREVDIPKRGLDFLCQERERIEAKIIKQISALYPERRITRPYLSKE